MRSIRRILVAVKDPAARSLPAVTKAAQLARALGAHLELFHGISTPLYVDAYSYRESLADIEQKMKAERVAQLESIARNLRARKVEASVSVVWDFPVYEAIVRHSARSKIDLIVAEQHAKPHVTPGLLQLTDWELLRTSTVPVLLVKTRGAYKNPVILAAVDPAHTLSKPANLDEEILRVGKCFASALRGPLHAVHAYIPAVPQTLQSHIVGDETLKKLEARTADAARHRLSRVVEATGIPKPRCHVVARHPIDAIEQTARKVHSDIVVMGAMSRSGIKRLFFGNTAEALLDSLNCDLLIVKPVHFAARVPKRMRGIRYAVPPYIPGI
jgi:universal stress protein E